MKQDSPLVQGSGVWILAEQAAGLVQRVSFELLARGRDLADRRGVPLTAVLLGPAMPQEELDRLIRAGADEALAVESPALMHFLVEPHAACLRWLVREHRPEILLAAATSTGRTLMPYVAALIGTGLTADCTLLEIEPETGHLLQTRPAIGGNILATIKTALQRPQMATVRPHSCPPAAEVPDRRGTVRRVPAPADCLASRVSRVGFLPAESERGVQDADVVVAVGKGIRKADNIGLAAALARRLGAAMGASRDVVDRGWLSYPHQVGLSGKTVSPKLYIALGISGAVQHLAGMQTAETIIAVNKDPDAPIFRVADFGIVGDLFDVVPALIERLGEAGNKR